MNSPIYQTIYFFLLKWVLSNVGYIVNGVVIELLVIFLFFLLRLFYLQVKKVIKSILQLTLNHYPVLLMAYMNQVISYELPYVFNQNIVTSLLEFAHPQIYTNSLYENIDIIVYTSHSVPLPAHQTLPQEESNEIIVFDCKNLPIITASTQPQKKGNVIEEISIVFTQEQALNQNL